MTATRTYSATSVARKTSLGMRSWLLAQPDPWIGDGVRDVGQDQPDDVQRGADEYHRAHNGEILRVDGVDRVAAEPRDAEERFHDQRAQEEQWQHGHGAGQDGQ